MRSFPLTSTQCLARFAECLVKGQVMGLAVVEELGVAKGIGVFKGLGVAQGLGVLKGFGKVKLAGIFIQCQHQGGRVQTLL